MGGCLIYLCYHEKEELSQLRRDAMVPMKLQLKELCFRACGEWSDKWFDVLMCVVRDKNLDGWIGRGDNRTAVKQIPFLKQMSIQIQKQGINET